MKFYDLNSRVSPETMWAVCLPGLRGELSGGAPSDCFFLIREKLRPDWSTLCFLGISYQCEYKLFVKYITASESSFSYEFNMLC